METYSCDFGKTPYLTHLFGDLDGDLLAGFLGDVVALLVVAVTGAGLLVRRVALLLVHPVGLRLVKVLAHLLVRGAALRLERCVENLPALSDEVRNYRLHCTVSTVLHMY